MPSWPESERLSAFGVVDPVTGVLGCTVVCRSCLTLSGLDCPACDDDGRLFVPFTRRSLVGPLVWSEIDQSWQELSTIVDDLGTKAGEAWRRAARAVEADAQPGPSSTGGPPPKP